MGSQLELIDFLRLVTFHLKGPNMTYRFAAMIICSGILFGANLSALAQEPSKATAEEKKAPVKIELAGGSLVLTAPAQWKQVQPRFPQMIQYEFSAPADAKGDAPVRITVMVAGGGLEGNLARWYGQFTQPDGKATKDIAQTEELKADGAKVYLVNITGTYAGDMMASGRNAPKKENYQLLGGIVETEKMGTYFIKATGPIEECQKLSDGFREMLKGMQVKKP